MRRNAFWSLTVIVLVLAALAAKSLLLSVPPVHDGAGSFDATRAKARLAFILGDQTPHPTDSAADDAVRGRLVATLRQMGLQPIVRDQFACNGFARARVVACARVRNVIALIGPHTGKALLLSAHYDSVPVGPGASDDGVGVATLLEVGAILSHRPLHRPIMLLFNEGEESGLIGARAFLSDPLSRDVDSVLNFEARGVTGPATMFETSRPNAAAVQAFAAVVKRPVASSLSTDVYHLLPNDTDVTAYNERGWFALNFAMTGNETRYHSPGDDLASLDPRSLQHMGDQALAISTELASNALTQASGQRVFMDVDGRALIDFPLGVAVILFAVLILAFALLVMRRRAFGLALAAPVAAVVGGGAAAWLATSIVGLLRHGTYWRAHPEFSFMAVYATVLFAVLVLLRAIGGRQTPMQLRATWWFLFLVTGGLLSIAAPGAIIYFLAPPVAVLLGVVASRWRASAETVGSLVALAIAYLSWGELLALLEVLFSPGPLWIVGPVSAFLIIPAMIEAHALFVSVRPRALAVTSGAIALIAWIVATSVPAYSADREQRFTIEHVTQFPSGHSYWSILNDGAELPSTLRAIGPWHQGKLDFLPQTRWLSPASPLPNLRPPSLQPLETISDGNERRVRLRIAANGADRVLVIAPPEAHIRTAGVPGFVESIADPDSSGEFYIACTGRSCDGRQLQVDMMSGAPAAVTVVGSRNGLPASAATVVKLRPKFARPQYTPDETLAYSRMKL